MKKIIAISLCCIFTLAALSAFITSPAAMVEGDWTTSRAGNDYRDDDVGYYPASGYQYTSDGFVTISPDVVYSTSYVQAHTKNPVNLKVDNDGCGNSVSLQFTVLDFAYGGERGIYDHWIALTLNSKPVASHGSTEYGEGLCILLRRPMDIYAAGRTHVEPFYVDRQKGFTVIQSWSMPTIDVPVNAKGQEVYSVQITYTSQGYEVTINDYTFQADNYLNNLLDRVCSDGAYVGLTMQSAVEGSTASFCINEWQGEIPYGEDSAVPEEDLREIAPIAGASTVPENQPAVLWDSTLRDFTNINIQDATYEINDDTSIRVKLETISPYVIFNVKSTVSYEATDFPYIAILTRNCFANNSRVYYCAGPNLSFSDLYSESWEINETEYPGGWSLGHIDLSSYDEDGWYERINSLRVDFQFYPEDLMDDDFNNFDIAFIAAFRSRKEALAYTEQYLKDRGYAYTPQPSTEPDTEYATIDEYVTEYQTQTKPGYNVEEVITEIYQDFETIPTDDNMGIGDMNLGNGLINELFGTDLFSSCTSVTAVPALVLLTAFGFAILFKKKD